MKASVIIPTYNRHHDIKDCLNSIFNCDDQELLQEAIVVDNGSTDGTSKFLKEYSMKQRKLKYLFLPEPNAINARNLGFKSAQGDVIVHIDDDIMVDKDSSTLTV